MTTTVEEVEDEEIQTQKSRPTLRRDHPSIFIPSDEEDKPTVVLSPRVSQKKPKYRTTVEDEEDEDIRREVQVERLNELLERQQEQEGREQREEGVSVEVQTEEPEVTQG